MNTEFIKKINKNLFRNAKQEKIKIYKIDYTIKIYKIDYTIKKCIYCNSFHDIKYHWMCYLRLL